MKQGPEGKTEGASRPARRQGWRRWWVHAFLVFVSASPLVAHAQYLRIVNYNVEADVNNVTTPRDGLFTVLEAIGEQNLNGVLQAVDILALQETTSNATTVVPVVTALNGYYGAGTYAASDYQGTQSGSAMVGNGPNALVYNTKTVQLVASGGVGGTPNQTAGIFRQVVRYQFHAVGAAAAASFYVYVSHMKSSTSGTTAAVQADRNAEAQAIRADVASLPAGTSAIYVGDFNMDGSGEPAYQTLTASGAGKSIDALNFPQNNAETWNAAYLRRLTESSTALKYRDDIQFMTADIYNGTLAAAVRYVPGSCRAFGNNGTSPYGKSVNTSANTSLNNLVGPITAAQALTALTTGSDHLPEVADYVVATPYNTWQLQHFTAAELGNAAIRGDLADPDGDGIPNLLEYALDLDPKAAETTGLPTVGQMTVAGSTHLTLTYTQVIAATGITYLPQVSGDLTTWNGNSSYTVVVGTTANADGLTRTVVVRDAVAISSTSKRFMRLQVSRP